MVSPSCLQCRKRKVKCLPSTSDNNRCLCCNRLDWACSFSLDPDTPSEELLTLLDIPRRRLERACTECRRGKRRCSGESPRCSLCIQRGRSCQYVASKRTHTNIFSRRLSRSSSENDHRMSSSTDMDPPSSMIVPVTSEPRELIHLFFDRLSLAYPLGILHRDSILQRLGSGTLDPTLLSSVCAFTVRRLRNAIASESQWVSSAENTIWQNIEHPTIFRLQAMAFLIVYHIDGGNFSRAFMLMSLGARMATALRLNYEWGELPELAKEARRRLMWALVWVDGQLAIGLPEFEMLPTNIIYLEWPGSVSEFDGGAQDDCAGYWTLCTKVYNMRREVLKLNRAIRSELPGRGFRTRDIWPAIEEYGAKLIELKDEMPEYSREILESFRDSRWREHYKTMHLSRYQSYCDLYRLLMPGYAEALPDGTLRTIDRNHIRTATSSCLTGATAIVTMLTDIAAQATDADIFETDMAICAYHAARIILHISSSQTPDCQGLIVFESAVGLAGRCLAILRRFYANHHLAKHMISDLQDTFDRVLLGPEAHNPQSTRSDSERTKLGIPQIAKQRQRLGVHSIARQAGFADDPSTYSGSSPIAATSLSVERPLQPSVMHEFTPINTPQTAQAESQTPQEAVTNSVQEPQVPFYPQLPLPLDHQLDLAGQNNINWYSVSELNPWMSWEGPSDGVDNYALLDHEFY